MIDLENERAHFHNRHGGNFAFSCSRDALEMLVTAAIPTNSELREIREHLGLSQMELAAALGFRLPRGENVVRDWEKDPEFHPTPLAWCALRYMLMVVEIYRETDPETPAHAKISRLLPGALR